MNIQTAVAMSSKISGAPSEATLGINPQRFIEMETDSSRAPTFDLWRRRIKQVLPGLDVSSDRRELSGELSAFDFAGARLWYFRSGGQRVFRNRPCEKGRFAPMAIVVLRGRTHLSQFNRECDLREGAFAFFDSAQPLVLEYLEEFEHLYLHFPKAAFAPAAFHKVAAHAMKSDQGMNHSFADCVRSVWVNSAHLNPLQHGTALYALVSLANMTTAMQLANYRHSVPVRVSRAIAFIESNLGESWLNPRSIAESQQISRRHLDELFRQCGHRIESWIWERRLERAAEELACYCPTRGLSRKTILQIAFDLGFKSPSHFSRTFAGRFGVSPREYRRRLSGQRLAGTSADSEAAAAAS
jgi:AraC-like DNA-binding protein